MPVGSVVSFQAEKIIGLECYKFYWLHRTIQAVLIYKSGSEGYESYTRTRHFVVQDIEGFEKFVNNYEGERWGADAEA